MIDHQRGYITKVREKKRIPGKGAGKKKQTHLLNPPSQMLHNHVPHCKLTLN